MNLQMLLGAVPKAMFVADQFHRLPFSSGGTAKPLLPLGSWQTLGTILQSDNVDMLIVRDGQQYCGGDPQSLEAAQALSAQGYTIVVRHAERHHDGLQELAASFEQDFDAPVNIHLYATPAGGRGFSWHYDAEDVFIIQTAGCKEYSLRKNTVQPWPLEETIPQDMHYPREIMPLMRTVLTAGDWLYIPCGYWHKADATASPDTAISLAIGVMSPAAIEIYDFLRTHLLDSLLWRQRLPVTGKASVASPEELLTQYLELLEPLAADLAATLRDPSWIERFLARRKSDA